MVQCQLEVTNTFNAHYSKRMVKVQVLSLALLTDVFQIPFLYVLITCLEIPSDEDEQAFSEILFHAVQFSVPTFKMRISSLNSTP